MERNDERRILRNALSTFVTRLLLVGVGLVLTPYLLVRLGDEPYGVWVLLGATVGFMSLVDLGLGTSFVKFVAEYDARGDRRGLNAVYTTGLVAYLALAIVVIAVLEPVTSTVLRFFFVPATLFVDARFVLTMLVLSLLVSNIGAVYKSMIDGRQRMDLSNRVVVASTLFYAVAAVVALELGFGLRGLASSQLASRILSVAVMAHSSFRLDPSLRLEPGAIRAYGGVLARYGLNLQVSRVAELVSFQFDKLLVSRFLGASLVTSYDIGARIPTTARSFPAMLLSVLTPAAADIGVRRGRDETYALYDSASRYAAAMAFGVFVALGVVADSVIRLWVGPGYESAAVVLRISCVGLLCNVAAGPVSPLVQGLGRVDIQRNTQILSLIVNVVLSVLLIQRYGFYGAPIGTAVALVMSSAYYVWAFHRFVGRSLVRFSITVLGKPALAAAIAAVPSWLVNAGVSSHVSGGRVSALLAVAASGGLFALLFGALVHRWRYVDLRRAFFYRSSS